MAEEGRRNAAQTGGAVESGRIVKQADWHPAGSWAARHGFAGGFWKRPRFEIIGKIVRFAGITPGQRSIGPALTTTGSNG